MVPSSVAVTRKAFEEAGGFDSNNFEFIDRAKQIVIKEGKQWKTFQEFYVALRNQGMV